MSDIRFNQWLHQSGTGGVSQSDGGHVGIGTTNPLLPVGAGNTHILHVGVVTSNSISAGSSITATTFYGSGANLTSLPSQLTLSNNANNRVITGGSGVNLNGESNLTFDGSTLGITKSSDGSIIQTRRTGNTSGGGAEIRVTDGFSSTVPVYAFWYNNNTGIGNPANNTTSFIQNASEKLRITSGGDILLNKGNNQNTLMSNTSDGSDNQSIFVGGGGGPSDTRGAYIWAKGNEYTTTGGFLQLNAGNVGTAPITFSTGGNERARIDNQGDIFIGTTSDIAPANGTNLCVSDATISRLILEKQSTIKFGLNVSSGFTIYDETNDAARFSIASNGQVSISSDGTTDGLLTIKGNSDQVSTPSIRLLDGSDTREVSISNTAGDFVASVHGNDNAIHGHIKMFESGQIDFNNGGASGSNTIRLRITTDGDIRFGTTTASIFNEKFRFFTTVDEPVLNIDSNSTGTSPAVILRHARGGLSGFNGKAFSFVGNDSTEEGSIVIHTTVTAYNTSSDYRLKENEVAISDGITRLKQLKPYQFNFKKEPTVKVDGFFAHEVSSIVPIAVTGEKDAVKEDGSIEPQGIDHSKLVPLLTAALQEAITKIETLETKVAALESS